MEGRTHGKNIYIEETYIRKKQTYEEDIHTEKTYI